MRKGESETISARIAQVIAEQTPYVDYTPADLEKARQALKNDEERLREKGYLGDDFETYYVIKRFCDGLGLGILEPAYLRKLFWQAQKLDAEEFRNNPYLSTVHVPEITDGRFLLTNMPYERGEIFQYDMPHLREDLVVPFLGFFNEAVSFPSIFEDGIPWMSVCPSEMNSMKEDIEKAHGRVLVLGAGLGYYPFMISLKQEVKSIDIIEYSPEILAIFEKYLLPQFPEKEKIHLILADAIRYMDDVRPGNYDFCYADIWEGQLDGVEKYLKIQRHEKRLPGTEFAYWIGDAIEYCIEEQL